MSLIVAIPYNGNIVLFEGTAQDISQALVKILDAKFRCEPYKSDT